MHRNLYWLPLVLIPLLLLGCSHSQQPAPPQPQVQTEQGGVPAIVLFETKFDLGKIREDGISNVHEFKVGNKGTGLLEIKKVVPGCGSSVLRFDKTIPPGGEGTIKVSLNPKGCTARTKSKSFLVLTNDPEKKYFQLELAGHAD
ncbi:MAG: DUF1573 domain-containing protein [Syntrophobacteraceae bacterium]